VILKIGAFLKMTILHDSPRREQTVRRVVLRKSIPFVLALLIGTLAAALVAGMALFAAHF
jgi:hypothetical protein